MSAPLGSLRRTSWRVGWWIFMLVGFTRMIVDGVSGQIVSSEIGALHAIAGAIVLMTDEAA